MRLSPCNNITGMPGPEVPTSWIFSLLLQGRAPLLPRARLGDRASKLKLPKNRPTHLQVPTVTHWLLTLRSSSRSGAELLVSPGPLEGMAGSWVAGGRLGLHGAGGLLGFGEGIIVALVSECYS